MDSVPKQFYHIHGFPTRNYLELFYSNKDTMAFAEDTLTFPMTNLHYVFSSGYIRGDLLIDLSHGSFIHHLYSASNVFKDIILMRPNETCIMEVHKWLSDRTGAFDWTHTKTAIAEMEGKSDQIHEKDLNLKASIRQIVTCSFENENLTDPVVLPNADCIISFGLLDVISKDQDDYMRNMGKISNLLKNGGHLILVGELNGTYFHTGGDPFHALKYDENFVRSALSKMGFVIDYFAVQRRNNVSDLANYTDVIFITAYKEK